VTKPVFKSTARKPLGEYSVEIKAGDFVFSEGDLGTEMFIIHDGRVGIFQHVSGDDKQLAVFEKGDFFGEMSLLEDLPRTASAQALTDVKLLQINGATFSQMLRDHPEIAIRMMRKLSRRLRETDRLLRDALVASGAQQPPASDVPSPDNLAAKAGDRSDLAVERLVHVKSGMEFHLALGSETSIGRKDPVTGIYPDIDLTPVDGQRSISRRHAKIYRRGSKFFLSEEIGSMNGTYRNGQRLETGVPAEISPGDEVRVGMVVTTFQID
jgi:Cyclic nucleotide-binding domain/FHA domain